MGWFWPSTSPAASDHASTSSNIIAQSPPSPTSPPLTRDEVADKELQSILAELSADTSPSSTKYSRVPKTPLLPTSGNPEAETSSSPDLPLSEQLLPRSMSCRDAFDAAFYCNSLGGQFNNLYRYGTVRACSDNWNDFWFCMRTRGFGKGEREEAVRGRYREKERSRYARQEGEELGTPKSSEDVWRSRQKKLEWGEAFNEPVEEFGGDDEEWNRTERERRRAVNGTMS